MREWPAANRRSYTDALQVSEGTKTGLFWIGQILVAANPFNSQDLRARCFNAHLCVGGRFKIHDPSLARTIFSAPTLKRAEPARFWPPSTTTTHPDI